MNEDLASDRERDRAIRARIDPLLTGLTPLGKIELATRLAGESLMDAARRTQRPAIDAPVVVVRAIERAKEEGEREEAPERSGSPSGDGSAPEHPNPTSHEGGH